MIRVDGKVIEFTKFPDGTTSFKFALPPFATPGSYDIEWRYDGDHECIYLWYLVKHIRSFRKNVKIYLYMPYIPNARMDRVKAVGDVFTLKWFAEFINSLEFDQVRVFDPHSNVSTALIDRSADVTHLLHRYIKHVIKDIGDKDILLCYPDEGSTKRYSSGVKMEYVFGIKHRDWESGDIQSLELTSPEKVNGRNVLIVDDICSRGGTFTHMAKALKDAGANNIYLYVSHCENTIFNGEVLTDGLISHVYTTDSIFRGEHPNISVIKE